MAASPGSETEEEELIDGICTFNGIRATPPRLLFTPTPPDSGGGVPDKFAPLCEVVWQSPPPRERGGSQVHGRTVLRQVHLGLQRVPRA